MVYPREAYVQFATVADLFGHCSLRIEHSCFQWFSETALLE